MLPTSSMPRAQHTIRRRPPKQERSRRLVEAIVEATRITLTESGLDALTTVNVAQRAGVSVGSLYQYFAGRDALLLAVHEDELARAGRAWRAWRSERAAIPTRERIAEGLALALAHYRNLAALAPAFYLAQRDELRRALRPRRAREAAPAALGGKDDLLRARAVLKHERLERVDAASFIVTRGITGLLEAALAHQPEVLATPEFEQELNALVAGYLLRERD